MERWKFVLYDLNLKSYTGEVHNGLRHGQGIYKCAPPSKVYYDGEWVNGKRQGKGKIFYDEISYYEGDWENGVREGFGFIRYPSGNE